MPREVVWVGRQGESAEVDSKAEKQLNWIHIHDGDDSASMTLTEAGKAVAGNITNEVKDSVRWRLEKWAEEQLRAVLAGLSSPDVFQALGAVGQWVVTHGLWLVCSSERDEDGAEVSHSGFANYMMNTRWWGVWGGGMGWRLVRQ